MNPKHFHYNKINKAYGLVEVLIALVIVAATMIVGIGTIADGLRISKENEIRDQATGVMLRAMEYANGYDQLPLPFDPSTLQYKCYKLDFKPDNTNPNYDPLQFVSNCNNVPISSCASNDAYLVNIIELEVANESGFQVCNQVTFSRYSVDGTRDLLISQNKIRITSTVVYIIDGRTEVQKVEGYRNVR